MAGLVHIYTGDSKGKTAAAIGLGIRASGNGLKVLIIQFFKGVERGEIAILKKLAPNLKLCQSREIKGFFWNRNGKQKKSFNKYTDETLNDVVNLTSTGEFDMLILDGVMEAISNGLIFTRDIVHFIKNKPDKLEVILTGRNASKELMEIADCVSEKNPINHRFRMGIVAKRKIEVYS